MRIEHARAPRHGVRTLMHVGNDGLPLEAFDRSQVHDISKTVGWVGTGFWAAGFVSGDRTMRHMGFWVAVSAWLTHLTTR